MLLRQDKIKRGEVYSIRMDLILIDLKISDIDLVEKEETASEKEYRTERTKKARNVENYIKIIK